MRLDSVESSRGIGNATGQIIARLGREKNAMRATELAVLLGVTRQHVYKMAAQQLIPSFRLGKAVRFDPAQVADWLRRKMPAPAVAQNREQIAV